MEETLLERFEPLHLDWNYIESHHWAHHAFAQSITVRCSLILTPNDSNRIWVVYLPLWKIWKSVGFMTFPIYRKIKHVPKPPTRNDTVNILWKTQWVHLQKWFLPLVSGCFWAYRTMAHPKNTHCPDAFHPPLGPCGTIPRVWRSQTWAHDSRVKGLYKAYVRGNAPKILRYMVHILRAMGKCSQKKCFVSLYIQ